MNINDKIPAYINIGYRSFEIIPLEYADFEMTDKYGWCDKINNKIYIYVGTDPMMTADTLLHEVMHAVWAFMGLDEKHDEEPIVARLTTGLLSVLFDNLDLLEFIQACIEYAQRDDDEEEETNEERFNATTTN